jgi:hypothetical protein
MRARRDPFARVEYIPERSERTTCDFCGTPRAKGHPIRNIRQESDAGRSNFLTGAFCSWSCAEAYHGANIGR